MNNRKTAVDSIHFQDRDLALLRGLFECRVMTTNHAAALYFDHKDDAAKKRLQKIKAAGFISERSPGLRERPLAWVEFVLFARRYFAVGAGGAGGCWLLPPAGGKGLSRNWSRTPVLAGW